MIFAIPAAIQTASIAAKVGALVVAVAVILSIGAYVGDRWQSLETANVQAKFDRFKTLSDAAAAKQDADAKLENQRLLKEKEIVDEQNARARDSLDFYARQLRELTKASASGSIMPRPPANTTRVDLTCFDRAELDRADADYRAGRASRTERIHALVEKGAEATVDLNSAKSWAQKFPKPQPNN